MKPVPDTSHLDAGLFRESVNAWSAHDRLVAKKLDEFKADAQQQLEAGATRDQVAERWQVATEAVDWILEDRWPRIAGVADRGWSVLSMVRESHWYTRNGLVQVHRTGLTMLACYWHNPDLRVVHELEAACAEAEVTVVSHGSPWSRQEVEAAIDTILASLGEHESDLLVHDCVLQPDGLYFAVTTGTPDPPASLPDDLERLVDRTGVTIRVYWAIAEALRKLDTF